MLMEKQYGVSLQFPFPVENIGQMVHEMKAATETVSFIVASTNVADAGSAAGTIVYAKLKNPGILNTDKTKIGNVNDTTFAFVTGTILTTAKGMNWKLYEQEIHQGLSRATRMANIGAQLSNGEFVVDHRTGLIIGKKATTGTSDTCNYWFAASDIPTKVIHGQKTIAATGTEEALVASSTPVKGVIIKALATNAGTAYVGANPVTTSTGYPLAAGEEVAFAIRDLADVYVDVGTSGDKVAYLAVV